MKFYSCADKTTFRLGLVLAISITISGCATLERLLGGSAKMDDKNVQVQEQVASDTTQEPDKPDSALESTEAKPNLTPEQMRIAELKAKPNLYFAGSPFPPEAASILFQQALSAKQQNEFEPAERLFTKVTNDFPKLSGPYMQLGDLVLNRHYTVANPTEEQIQLALTAAANYYQKAIGVNQHNYFAHNRLAKIYREQGQFELAESHYKQAIDSWPAFDTAYLNLGILYDLYLGKKVLALRQYETYQALQDSPGRKVNGWIADLKRQIARVNRQ